MPWDIIKIIESSQPIPRGNIQLLYLKKKKKKKSCKNKKAEY